MTLPIRKGLESLALLLILAALVALFGLLSDRFLAASTFANIANRIPTLAILATGMTLVLVVGGIDLSVGSVLALAGAAFGLVFMDWQWPLPPALLAAVAVGLLAGLVNGGVTVGFRVPSFIVTLGMLEMARGSAYLLTGSQTKYLDGRLEGFVTPLGGLMVTPAFLVAVAVVVLAHLMLTRSVFGRKMIATGTNESATRLAGIDPRPVKLIVFAMAGALAGLAALCHLARLGASDPNAGGGMELAAIAAAVIGGTSLNGGRGSVLRTFLGVLIIATLETGLAQIGASEPVKRLVTGSVIVLAVIVDQLRERRAG